MPELNEISFLKTLTSPSIGATVDNPTTTVVSSSVNTLFDAVTTAEATTGTTDYRCIYIHNASTTESLTSAELFIQTPPTSGTVTLSMGLGDVISSITMANNPALTSETDGTNLPVGLTFNVPLTATPLAVGTIPAGSYQILWLRRSVAAATVANPADYSKFVIRW